MSSSVNDSEKLRDKMSDDDRSTIVDALTDTKDWLNANDEAEADEFEEKLKELQSICDPIIKKIYGSMGGGNADGGEGDDDDEFEEEDL